MSKDTQNIKMGVEEKLKDLFKTLTLSDCQYDAKCLNFGIWITPSDTM